MTPPPEPRAEGPEPRARTLVLSGILLLLVIVAIIVGAAITGS